MQTEHVRETAAEAVNTPLPGTSTTPKTIVTTMHPSTPQAPKKPKAKIPECVKPDAYESKGNAVLRQDRAVLNSLSKAGLQQSQCASTKKEQKKMYPAPQKLLIAIVDGETGLVIHKYMPVHVLMQVSIKATEVLEPRPWAGKYKVYGPYDTSTLKRVLEALIARDTIPVHSDDLIANLLTYEVCLRLGISSGHAYAKALLDTVCAQIASTAATSEILQLITYRLGPEDIVFKHIANVLCHQRFKKEIDDVKAFENMVARKPALQKAMMQIDQAHKARRDAINASRRKSMKEGATLSVAGAQPRPLETIDAVIGDRLEKLVEGASSKHLGGIAENQKEALLEILKSGMVAEPES